MNSRDIDGVSKFVLPSGKIMYRARVYEAEKDKEEKNSLFKGYGPRGSFVPINREAVSNGRINPEGIVYLYCAESIPTAVAEISPLLKSEVSVAQIRCLEQIDVVSFCKIMSVSSGTNTPVNRWKRQIFVAFTQLFNQRYLYAKDYILCQYISEFYKNLGCDGIAFRSSRVRMDYSRRSNNICYTIFNYSKCEPIQSERYYVANLTYELSLCDDAEK